MRNLSFIVIFFGLLSCSNKTNVKRDMKLSKCDTVSAKEVCKKYLEKKKLLTFDPKINISDSLNLYIIEIYPESQQIKGGGGKFIVSKIECTILDVELYQ